MILVLLMLWKKQELEVVMARRMTFEQSGEQLKACAKPSRSENNVTAIVQLVKQEQNEACNREKKRRFAT